MSEKYFKNAKHLVEHCKNEYGEIVKSYNKSLTQKEIAPKLLIEIKNFMENLRSALDYCARGLFDKYGDHTKKDDRIYFPYAYEGMTQTEFISKNIIEQKIPGITASRPDIKEKIEGYQYFSNDQNNWLPVFMELNNKNKHQELTPQEKKETKQLKISSGGVSMLLNGGANISLGRGCTIRMGGVTIHGGQSFNANNPPITTGEGAIEIITWVSFTFSINGQPVMHLLDNSLKGINKIVDELSSL
jgi:hypothetical protein